MPLATSGLRRSLRTIDLASVAARRPQTRTGGSLPSLDSWMQFVDEAGVGGSGLTKSCSVVAGSSGPVALAGAPGSVASVDRVLPSGSAVVDPRSTTLEAVMIPSTIARVAEHTNPVVNDRIRHETEWRIRRCAAQGSEAMERRLIELDREWDIERTLEANAASVSIVGLALGVFVNRKFLAIPALVGGFLLQHAVHGWCPPVPLLRRLGVRTPREIDIERSALKALRGDFRSVAPSTGAAPSVDEAVRQAIRAAEA